MALSSDVEVNPGPNSSNSSENWNCGVCNETCGWDHQAVACDECGKWYHTGCQGIPTTLYHKMNSGFAWSCLQCGLPNFSSALFNISLLDSANRYSSLCDESLDSSDASDPGFPLASSSPVLHQGVLARGAGASGGSVPCTDDPAITSGPTFSGVLRRAPMSGVQAPTLKSMRLLIL